MIVADFIFRLFIDVLIVGALTKFLLQVTSDVSIVGVLRKAFGE